MKPKTQSPGCMPAAALAFACAVTASAPLSASENAKAVMNPADASASVPAATYKSALPGTRNDYINRTDVPRLPWRTLFKSDGDFAPVDGEDGGASDQHKMPMSHSAAMPAMTKPAPSASDGSDARGVIKSIDRKRGKVKLKHGPIQRLDMPGMTMVFRVKDPALLEQVSKGDTVGFTLDVEGSIFYVTGFQK
ncbi:MAG: Cu(I)/Ag(I) efflux system protein CusF [Gammaproteobacteria bacterium]